VYKIHLNPENSNLSKIKPNKIGGKKIINATKSDNL